MKFEFVAWSAVSAFLLLTTPASATSVVTVSTTGPETQTPQAGPGNPPPTDAARAGQAAPAAPPADTTLTPQAAPTPPPKPEVTLRINIELTKQQMTVQAGGGTSYVWPVSSARQGYRTPTGTFTPQWMARMWYSRQYEYSPMPHSIFFKDGVAIHGTSYTGMLGRPASHGCVRLAPKNAATLYALVNKHGKESTRIAVVGSPRFKDDLVAGRSGARRGYDDDRRRQAYEVRRPSGYGSGYSYGNPFWFPWQ
jgi:lipoprotein-anchoring transpeptidase ErfK/SrfK